MTTFRILMVTRDTIYSSPGGDTIQITSTSKYLKKLGVDVDLKLTSEKIDYQLYNLIHFFNIIRPDDILPHMAKTKLPYVVSTILVDYSEFEKNNRKGLFGLINNILNSDQIEYMKSVARFIKNGDKIKSMFFLLRGQRTSIVKVAKNAKFLLPNSDSEYRRFNQKYKIDVPYKKVPNAIDLDKFNSQTRANKNYLNHVISVGRIEGRKNQLNLIKALIDTDINLTLIGKPSPNHMAYFEECKKLIAGKKNMQIIEHIDQEELAGIYKAAKVHVLPSWFETTGLSSLEAAVMGCNIVVTKKGDTEEYFQNFAYYCEPNDVMSIRGAVLEAFNSPIDANFEKMVLDNYTWEKAASKTLEAYREVLL